MSDKNIVKVKKDEKTGEYYFDIQDIVQGTNLDPNLIKYYTMEANNKTIILKFFDKYENQINVKNAIRRK